MRKLTFAFAVLASIGAAAISVPASAAPGMPMGVTAADTVAPVQMTRREHRMMHRRMHHRRMMHHRMHHRRMMHRRMHRM